MATDQGHVAVIIDECGFNVLDQNIIHAYAIDDYASSVNKKNVGTTGITNFRYSHYFSSGTGYYTHVCEPDKWLLIDWNFLVLK